MIILTDMARFREMLIIANAGMEAILMTIIAMRWRVIMAAGKVIKPSNDESDRSRNKREKCDDRRRSKSIFIGEDA